MTPVQVVVELACHQVSRALAEYPKSPKDLTHRSGHCSYLAESSLFCDQQALYC